MQARRIFGWIILLGAATYAATKAAPVWTQVSDSTLGTLLIGLIMVLLVLAIVRILSR